MEPAGNGGSPVTAVLVLGSQGDVFWVGSLSSEERVIVAYFPFIKLERY